MTEENNKNVITKTPIDKGKMDINDLFEANKTKLKACTFMSSCNLNYNDNYNLPQGKQFFCVYKYNTYICRKRKNYNLEVNLATNFIIDEVKECSFVFNNTRQEPKIEMQYLITVKQKNKLIKDIKIEGKAKSDVKTFQEILNSKYNGLQISMKENEFKTYVTQYISDKNNSKNVEIYSNAGNIGNGFLYQNSFVEFGKEPIWADQDGYIKVSENKYIKVSNDMINLPMLIKNDKSANQITKEYIENIIASWNGAEILPLMAIGLMVMAVHYETFILKEGYPILIIFGATSGGKSTITLAGLQMQGMSRDSLHSGSSTAKSNEHYCSKYNGINVCIDDIKDATISSNYFTDVVKTAYTGTIRSKMGNFGKNAISITLKSPLVYSSNAKSPQEPEVQNRILTINVPKGKFNPKLYKYFATSEKSKELCLILPKILIYSKEEVLRMHAENEKLIEVNIPNISRRIVNNNAIAFTGLKMLQNIGNVEIENLEEKFIDFVKNQVKHYDELKNVVDKVLAEIAILYQLGQIEKDVLFRIQPYKNEDGTLENVICFNKNSLIAKINQCNFHDKSRYIDKDLFNVFAKEHPRYRGSGSVRYKVEPTGQYTVGKDSVRFCIDGLSDYSVFYCVEECDIAPPTIKENDKHPF